MVRLWDASTGASVGSKMRSVRVSTTQQTPMNTRTRHPDFLARGHSGPVLSVAFSPDGSCGNDDKMVTAANCHTDCQGGKRPCKQAKTARTEGVCGMIPAEIFYFISSQKITRFDNNLK